MKFLILLILLASCTGARQNTYEAPTLTGIHIVDRDGMTEAIGNPDRLKSFEEVDFLDHQPYQKVLRVYSRDSVGNVQAYITTYHPNGQIKQYLEVLNNRAYGSYREWFGNGTLKVETSIIEGVGDISLAAEKSWLFDGMSTAYNECGAKIAEIPYCRGSLDGIATYFHSGGSIWKQIPYSQNLICGQMRIFLENGTLLQTTEYEKGIKNGPSIRYWQSGIPGSSEQYQEGRLIEGQYNLMDGTPVGGISKGEGFKAIFSKDALSELHEYHFGLPEGEIQVFDQKGRVIRIYHIKKGLKHGEEIIFRKEKEPKLSIPWYQGKIQGVVKSWYDNGQIESQKELSENKRNGVSTAWYRDGKLMLIEEYDVGKLMKGDYYRKGYREPVSQVVGGNGTVTLFDPEGNYLKKIQHAHGKPEE